MPAHTLLDGERLILSVREHWIKYVPPAILYVLLLGTCMTLFWLGAVSAYHTGWLAESALVLAIVILTVTHHWFFWVLLSETQACIIVTSKRVIHVRERILLADEMVEISFEKMKTVEAHKKGFLPYLLHYGTLQFETGAVIRRVPHPNAIAKSIEKAMGLD